MARGVASAAPAGTVRGSAAPSGDSRIKGTAATASSSDGRKGTKASASPNDHRKGAAVTAISSHPDYRYNNSEQKIPKGYEKHKDYVTIQRRETMIPDGKREVLRVTWEYKGKTYQSYIQALRAVKAENAKSASDLEKTISIGEKNFKMYGDKCMDDIVNADGTVNNGAYMAKMELRKKLMAKHDSKYPYWMKSMSYVTQKEILDFINRVPKPIMDGAKKMIGHKKGWIYALYELAKTFAYDMPLNAYAFMFGKGEVDKVNERTAKFLREHGGMPGQNVYIFESGSHQAYWPTWYVAAKEINKLAEKGIIIPAYFKSCRWTEQEFFKKQVPETIVMDWQIQEYLGLLFNYVKIGHSEGAVTSIGELGFFAGERGKIDSIRMEKAMKALGYNSKTSLYGFMRNETAFSQLIALQGAVQGFKSDSSLLSTYWTPPLGDTSKYWVTSPGMTRLNKDGKYFTNAVTAVFGYNDMMVPHDNNALWLRKDAIYKVPGGHFEHIMSDKAVVSGLYLAGDRPQKDGISAVPIMDKNWNVNGVSQIATRKKSQIYLTQNFTKAA